MPIIQRSVCKVNALNPKGLGVAALRGSSEVVEIPYSLPGEVIEFQEHFYRNKSSFSISRILEKSPNRVDPPCKYFTICGGCLLQHLETSYYYQYKLQMLQDSLKSRGLDTKILPMKSVGSSKRRRAVFEAVKKHDQVFLGFKKYRSDQIVNIDSCLVLLPELSDLIVKLKIDLSQILANKEKCKILVTKADNGIDLIIEAINNFEFSEEKIALIKDFAIKNAVIKVTVVTSKWNIVHFSQQPYVVFGDAKVAVDSYSFLQVSKSSDIILAELIDDVLSKVRHALGKKLKIIDLFCGRGTLSLPAAAFGAVDGFELEKSSVKALKEAISGVSEINIYERDLFTKPIGWDYLSRYDVAIINPPRAGAKEQSKALEGSAVRTIIYLSCDVESFAHDAQIILQNKRYKLKEIMPIDQFYWSNHLEIFAVFAAV